MTKGCHTTNFEVDKPRGIVCISKQGFPGDTGQQTATVEALYLILARLRECRRYWRRDITLQAVLIAVGCVVQ